MYKVQQHFDDQPVISFSLPYSDWCLLEQSEFWHRLDRYLEVCQSTDAQTQQEKINLLEKKDILYELRENRENKSKKKHNALRWCVCIQGIAVLILAIAVILIKQ